MASAYRRASGAEEGARVVGGDTAPDGMGFDEMGDDGTSTGALTSVVGTRRVYPPEPGDPITMGPHTVLCRLPRGGQGADVFVAKNVDDDGAQLVVIKCLPPDAGELNRRRFAREV